MYVIATILGLVPGVIIFYILNSIFNIYYFGWKGIVSTFTGCWFAGAVLMYLVGVPVIILAVIAGVLYKICGSKKTTGAETENKIEDGSKQG